MTADPGRRHPLAGLEARLARASWPGAVLTPLPFLTQMSLRCRPGLEVGGIPLPAPGRVTGSAVGSFLGIGPDEWLVVAPDGAGPSLLRLLEASVVQSAGAIVDLSEGRTGFRLAGSAAPDVLATCCPIDTHASRFGPGRCAATLLGRAPVIIEQTDPAPGFRILVRPSFAAHVADWLVDGMTGVRAAG